MGRFFRTPRPQIVTALSRGSRERWGQARQSVRRWQSTVMLDLDESEARLLVTRQGRPEKWDAMRIPGGLYSDGVITDPENMAGMLDTLFQRCGVSRRGVRVTAGGFHAVMRTVTMPKLKPRFMPEAIRRQMKREVPVTLEDHHLIWQIIGRTDEEVKALVVGVPRNELDSVLKTLRFAGVQPASLQWKPLAVLRALGTPNAAVVVLESSSFDIILSRDGLPRVTRNVPYPPTARDLSQRVEVASTELGLAVSYVMLDQGEETSGDPRSVFLLGQSAESDAVRERFEESSGYQLDDPEFLNEGAPLWAHAPNLGAVQPRSSSAGAPFLDLTPEDWRPTTVNAFEGTAAVMLAVGLGIVALPFFHSLQPDPRVDALQQQVDQAKIQVRVDKAHAIQAARISKQASDAQAQLVAYRQGFSTLQSERLRWPQVASSTPASLADVNIQSVSESGKSLSLTGNAPTYSQVTGYAQFLNQTGWFDQIQLTSLTHKGTKEGDASLDFHLTAQRVEATSTGGGQNAQHSH